MSPPVSPRAPLIPRPLSMGSSQLPYSDSAGGEPPLAKVAISCADKISTFLGTLCTPLTYCCGMIGQQVLGCCVNACNEDMQKNGKPIEYEKYQMNLDDARPSPQLTSSLRINQRDLSNRFVKAGITDGLFSVDGNPTKESLALYRKYAEGGYGMVITGDCSVDRGSRLAGSIGHTPIFDSQSDEKEYRDLAQSMGAGANILQLTHPGTVVPFIDKAVAPGFMIADSPRSGKAQFAHTLTTEEVNAIFQKFLNSARKAELLGFSGIQLVAANGYLPALFLDKNINERKDKWHGTSFVTELLTHLLEQRSSPQFIVGLKLNSSDFQKGGYSSEEAANMTVQFAQLGVHFIEIGGGNCESLVEERTTSSERERYFTDYGKKVLQNRELAVPVMATGDWRNLRLMERGCEKFPNLLIGLGRPTCIDPFIGNKLSRRLVNQIPDWFQVYMPPFVEEKLRSGDEDARRLAYGIETSWHALAASSVASGKDVPHVVGIFDNPLNALSIKVGIYFRGAVPTCCLKEVFCKNPMV